MKTDPKIIDDVKILEELNNGNKSSLVTKFRKQFLIDTKPLNKLFKKGFSSRDGNQAQQPNDTYREALIYLLLTTYFFNYTIEEIESNIKKVDNLFNHEELINQILEPFNTKYVINTTNNSNKKDYQDILDNVQSIKNDINLIKKTLFNKITEWVIEFKIKKEPQSLNQINQSADLLIKKVHNELLRLQNLKYNIDIINSVDKESSSLTESNNIEAIEKKFNRVLSIIGKECKIAKVKQDKISSNIDKGNEAIDKFTEDMNDKSVKKYHKTAKNISNLITLSSRICDAFKVNNESKKEYYSLSFKSEELDENPIFSRLEENLTLSKNFDSKKSIVCKIFPYLEKGDVTLSNLLRYYKDLPETLGITIKQIFLEIETQLANKSYILSYTEEATPKPFLQKKDNKRFWSYISISVCSLLLIALYCCIIPTSIPVYINIAILSLLTVTFSGFSGMLLYNCLSQNINRCIKKLVLANIKTAQDYKINKKQHKQKELYKELESTYSMKEAYKTDEMYINIGDYLKGLSRAVTNQDPVSKLISRKAKRLKDSIEKIEIVHNNQFVKTGRLRFISDFMREISNYAHQLNVNTSRHPVSEQNIQVIKNTRNIINQIEAKISLSRSINIILFFLCPLFFLFLINLSIYNFSSSAKVPASLYFSLGFLLLLLPIGYFGYSFFKFISIHKPLRFVHFLGWRQNSSRVEDAIATIFELIFFFIATAMLLVSYYYLARNLTPIEFFAFPNTNNGEKEFFYTVVSSFFPIEVFDGNLTDLSLLFGDQLGDAKGLRVIIRFLAVVLTTTLFVKFVQFLTEKYRKYSYDENSYNAFLPPELLKIFGYFILFIISTAISYSLVIAELKPPQKKISIVKLCESLCPEDIKVKSLNQCPKDCIPVLHPSTHNNDSSEPSKTASFGFTDFLPYSIFLALIATGFGISTRDLLENYFSGIAQRVDASFEEDDMVTIDDSKLMQVKTIGFKNVTFFDITQNAYRFIPFKQLDNQKIVNFTEPTLHFRRSIKLFVAKDQTFVPTSYLMANKPATLRAEMLLLLASFYVYGAKVPKTKNTYRIIPRKVSDLLMKNKEEQLQNALEDIIQDLVPNQPNTTLINNENIHEKLIDTHTRIIGLLEKDNKLDNNKLNYEEKDSLEYSLSLQSIKEVESSFSNTAIQEKIDSDKREIMNLVVELETGIDIAKSLKSYIRYLCKNNNVYIKYEEAGECSICDFEGKKKTDETNLYLIKINTAYRRLLLILADKAVEVSYLYYDLALRLWNIKEYETISKNETRSLDGASLDLLNVPRVTSTNVESYDPIMWKMELAVTLELAEQSDEIIHHINTFVDNHYVLFMGKRKSKTG